MANVTIAGGTTNLPVASTIDGAADYLPIYTASALATQAINRNTLMGITSGPVGLTDSQTLTNKTLGITNVVTLRGDRFLLQDVSDNTKQADFSMGAITTGTTRTYTLPDVTDTLLTLTATQTLTNKTLTSPTITSPTITNATISADTLSGYTSSTNGTVYGMSVTGGILASAAIAGQVITASIATNAVTAAKLDTAAITLGYAQITSTFTSTTTPAYVDVTGMSVAVTVPAGGRNVKITAFCNISTSGTAGNGVTFAIRESTTVLGASNIAQPVATYSCLGLVIAYVAAPSAGAHTYKVSASQSGAGTLSIYAGNGAAGATGPAFILVECI